MKFDHEFYAIPELRYADSYSRMGAVLDVFDRFPDRRPECFTLLGQEWSGCDNISSHLVRLRRLLRHANREELHCMMDDDERSTWERLSETITVYRGCYHNNKKGLSWSLSQDVASGFPNLIRYWQPGTPLLLAGFVDKNDVVLKLDRNEEEIIAPVVSHVRATRLLKDPTGGVPILTAAAQAA